MTTQDAHTALTAAGYAITHTPNGWQVYNQASNATITVSQAGLIRLAQGVTA